MKIFDRDRLIDKRPIRGSNEPDESEDENYEQEESSGVDLSQLDNAYSTNNPDKDIHAMVENWKQSIQSDEAQRKMLENYIRAYVDVTDEEMDEILSQHGF